MNFWTYLLAVNALTFFLYWADKRAARRQGPRIPEATLIVFGFLGGTLAAIAAQQMLRHKNRKRSFQLGFWAATLIQLYLLLAQPVPMQMLVARFH